MKTRNKLLTLLILSSGAAAATALINKAINFRQRPEMYWKNQRHCVISGV